MPIIGIQIDQDLSQIGQTNNANLTRDELIAMAYKEIQVLAEGEGMSGEQLTDGIKNLNLICREHDIAGKHLWGISQSPTSIPLASNVSTYTTANGLPTNVLQLVTVLFRGQNGEDLPLKLLTTEQYAGLKLKADGGDPTSVFLTEARLPREKALIIHPVPSVVTGKSILLWYRRPLYDFDQSTDNPDYPQGWTNWLKYRLAVSLAPAHNVAVDRINLLRSLAKESYEFIFKSVQPNTTEIHDLVVYF